MCKSIILLSLVSLASLFLSYSCKKTNDGKEPVKDLTGVWLVDSIATRYYPTDSVSLTYFSDTMSQKVIFHDKLYETVILQKDDTLQTYKMVYTLSGDTIAYIESNGETMIEEYIVSWSDTAMVTQCAVKYNDNTAEIYTVYYSRDNSSTDAVGVSPKVELTVLQQ